MVLQCAVVGKIMKKKFIIVFLLLLLVGLTGCDNKKPEKDFKRIQDF